MPQLHFEPLKLEWREKGLYADGSFQGADYTCWAETGPNNEADFGATVVACGSNGPILKAELSAQSTDDLRSLCEYHLGLFLAVLVLAGPEKDIE